MCIPDNIITLYRDIQGILVITGFPKVVSVPRLQFQTRCVLCSSDSTGLKLTEAIKNTHLYMSPVISQHDVVRSRGCQRVGRGKHPPLNAPKGKSNGAGRLRLGFKLLQRDIPAITVGPDTLLQGDGARGP